VVRCSYDFHPANNGIFSLREEIALTLTCRRCENNPCVQACPNQALQRLEGRIRRSLVMCVSCKSCSLACPFGTILPDLVPYLASRCDLCQGPRLEEKRRFVCVESCPYGALRLVEEKTLEGMKNLYPVNETLVVKAINWLDLYGVKK